MDTFVVRIDEPQPGAAGYPVCLINANAPTAPLAQGIIPFDLTPPEPGAWLSADDMLDLMKNETSENEAFKTMGEQLYRLLATGLMRNALSQLLADSSRTLLDIRPPALQPLPWEIIQDEGLALFTLESNPWCRGSLDFPPPFARLVDLGWPLRVLVIVGSEPGDGDVKAEDEVAALVDALRGVDADVDLWVEYQPQPVQIKELLSDRKFQPHVVHFIGHGAVNDTDGGHLLLFQEDEGNKVWSSAAIKTTLLPLPKRPRLVVLNACRTGDSGERGRLVTVGETFLQSGIPAVISMGADVTGQNAVEFSRQFYNALADQSPLDVAMAQARERIFQQVSPPEKRREWALPSLTVRMPPQDIVTLPRSPDDQLRIIRTAPFWVERQCYVDRREARSMGWRNLGAPGSNVVALVGEPQSGKSAFAHLLVERSVLAGRDARYVNFREANTGQALTMLDFLQGIVEGRPYAGRVSPLTDPLPDPAMKAFRDLVNVTPPPDLGKETVRKDVFEAFRTGLLTLAAARPLVLVLDNLERLEAGVFNAMVRPNLLEWWLGLPHERLKLVLVVTQGQFDELRLAELGDGLRRFDVPAFQRGAWAGLSWEYISRVMAQRQHTLTAQEREALTGFLTTFETKLAQQDQWRPLAFKSIGTLIQIVLSPGL